MEEIVKDYFESWIKKDANVLEATFAEDIVYIECYGPEYRGIDQVRRWFTEWNKSGTVLIWDIKRLLHCGSTVVAEWYFRYCYDGKEGEFDGVSVIEFDNNGKIIKLCEYKSESNHVHPFG